MRAILNIVIIVRLQQKKRDTGKETEKENVTFR